MYFILLYRYYGPLNVLIVFKTTLVKHHTIFECYTNFIEFVGLTLYASNQLIYFLLFF